MGSWFDHVSEYSAARNQLNIHFVQYENLLKVGDILLSIATTNSQQISIS